MGYKPERVAYKPDDEAWKLWHRSQMGHKGHSIELEGVTMAYKLDGIEAIA